LEAPVQGLLVGQSVLREAFQRDVVEEALKLCLAKACEQHLANTGGMGG
jgi:hypothetical protein